MDIAGKTIVCIGGTRGLGLATAARAAAVGANVVVASRNAERVEAAQATLGQAARAAVVDVTDEASVARLFEETGHVDHVVFTAGVHPRARIDAVDTAEMRPAVDTRIWGAYHTCKHAAARMPADGSITFITGAAVFKPGVTGESAAVAGAGGVEAFARSMALELAPIRVNTVSPGLCDTEFARSVIGAEWPTVSRRWAERLPVGRIGTEDDVADAILFVIQNGYVTGSTVHVDGGHRLV